MARAMARMFTQGWGWLGPSRVSCALVLLYHRVADLPSDPQLLAVSPQRFARHLEVLSRLATPMPLLELAAACAQGRLPKRAVALTFDDGYADNLHQAKPLLEKAGVPATVFVAAAAVDSPREFFWDDLERILLQPGVLPEKLQLTMGLQTHRWDLGGAARMGENAYMSLRGWSVADPNDPSLRHKLYRELCPLLRRMAPAGREQVMREIAAWAQVSPQGRSTYRALTALELQTLSRGGSVQIGAHGLAHAHMASLPVLEQQGDIMQGKAQLEAHLSQVVKSFSYPFGGRKDYTSDTLSLVRQAGFACACSNFPGSVVPQGDIFQMPRHLVRNWDGDKFERRLKSWWQAH